MTASSGKSGLGSSHDYGGDDVASTQLESLGVAEAAMGTFDPVGLARAFLEALWRSNLRPAKRARLVLGYQADVVRALLAASQRAVGSMAIGPASPAERDRRFTEPTWSENAGFYALLQLYLLNRKLLSDLVKVADLEEPKRSKASFAADLLSDALAPTNFLVTNPAALRRAFETGGLSVMRGARNFADDLVHNGGWPRQVDTTPFELGRNMAATPGQVVFRNELIELIQYEPSTEQVGEIPLLMCPPWINKYYIMDLAPGKSLAEWAVSHGMTTFAISYRNPDQSMAGTGFDDYMLKGPRAALDVICAITGAKTVNTISVCLGGTLTVALLAYLDAAGDHGLVNSSTLLNSLVDHKGAGVLSSVFTDSHTIANLERQMSQKGYLEASEMSRTFDLLRANELVFNYVARNWLMGEQPPAFDLLAWNHDSTRMPAKMHSFFLHSCWEQNLLATDRMELAGKRLAVSGIDVDTYIVAALEDHIVPWRSSYRTTQILKSDTRFVLSSSGHIAGIVNPPGPKVRLWTNPELPADPDQWLASATEHNDTWWNDWASWISERSGAKRKPPKVGSKLYPPLEAAPGSYVRA
ncbi:MAG: alpha/beta fold hydrolase [Actinobacteria bacterium]|nr:alpha/beta fold hydrolase [Actinomycetota bacterium]